MTMKLTNIRIHKETGEEIVTEWEVVKFSDENIIEVKHSDDLLFATTETGVVWVSSDEGQSWRLQGEILEELAIHYERQLEDAARAYHEELIDIEYDYLDKKKRYVK